MSFHIFGPFTLIHSDFLMVLQNFILKIAIFHTNVVIRPGAIPPSMIPTPIPIPAHLFDSDSDSSHLGYDSDSDSDFNTIFMKDSDSDSIPTL